MKALKNFFFKKKSYHKYGEVLKKKLSSKEQRMEAIEILEKLSAEDAIPELLKRFEIVIESGLQDTKEKERCVEAIVRYKDLAKPYITQYFKTQKRLAWVIRIAENIFTADEFLNLLLSNLNPNMIEFDDDAAQRNLDILHALADIVDARITPASEAFLTSRDDDMRLAALECLEQQAQADETARKIILNLAQNPTTDMNARFMGAVTHIVEKHNWSHL